MAGRAKPESRLATCEKRYRELAGKLAEVGFVMSGSVTLRYTHCGKPGCRCQADPPQPHGPYYQWTAKKAGKTVTRRLTPREAELYQEWIENDRQLRRLVDEMHTVAGEASEIILAGGESKDRAS